MRGGGRHRSGAEAVIAAQHDRHRAIGKRGERGVIEALAHARDVFHVFLARIARAFFFRNRGRNIALVADGDAELCDLIGDAGNAECGRPHVGAAAVAAEVEWDADDVNRLHRFLYVIEMPSWPGDTVEVNACGCDWIADRKSSISFFLLMTLCARKSPPGVTRGNTKSKNFL